MSTDDNYDYWTEAPQTQPAASEPALTIKTIDGVEPLDAQFGVAEPLTVPAPLQEVMFGQPDVIEGRAILPLHTYAVLDAAKVPGLPEMLETSGLDHTCLFQGQAAEELRDVAPWLVRLEEKHHFTRRLFTHGDAPWDMWDRELGIFLRSQGSLNDQRRHLRKFTRVRDEIGAWRYFRFWEPTLLATMSASFRELERFWNAFSFKGLLVGVDPFLNRAQVISFSSGWPQDGQSFIVDDPMRATMRQQRIESFARQLGRELLEGRKGEADRHQLLGNVQHALRHGLALHLTDTRHLARFVRLALAADAVDPAWLARPDIVLLLEEGHKPGRLLSELEYRVRASSFAQGRP